MENFKKGLITMPIYVHENDMAVAFERNKYAVHDSSFRHISSKLGEGTSVWHFCHICKDVIIGKNCTIGQNCYIGPGVTIGNNVKIQNNVSIYAGVTIENYVFIGPSVVFTNVLIPRSGIRAELFLKTVVKTGASIGANTTVICGNTIGEHSFVGAGSVVTKSVPKRTLVYGNPAKINGTISITGIITKKR